MKLILEQLLIFQVELERKSKVAVVAEDDKQKDAKESGADIVGGDDLIEKIKNGELNFEKLICTTSMMLKLIKTW